ncbi:MAG: hypothetical protein ABIK79_09715 [Chloroflexota bacterium]
MSLREHEALVLREYRGVSATKDDKDDKDDNIMTPVKDDKQDQWWDSSSSEYVVDTTITNDTNG